MNAVVGAILLIGLTVAMAGLLSFPDADAPPIERPPCGHTHTPMPDGLSCNPVHQMVRGCERIGADHIHVWPREIAPHRAECVASDDWQRDDWEDDDARRSPSGGCPSWLERLDLCPKVV